MIMMTQIDNLLNQTKDWFKNLTYDKKCIVIIFSIFVVFPILIATRLILILIAFILFFASEKIFQYGKKENDLFYLLPASVSGVFSLVFLVIWVVCLI